MLRKLDQHTDFFMRSSVIRLAPMQNAPVQFAFEDLVQRSGTEQMQLKSTR